MKGKINMNALKQLAIISLVSYGYSAFAKHLTPSQTNTTFTQRSLTPAQRRTLADSAYTGDFATVQRNIATLRSHGHSLAADRAQGILDKRMSGQPVESRLHHEEKKRLVDSARTVDINDPMAVEQVYTNIERLRLHGHPHAANKATNLLNQRLGQPTEEMSGQRTGNRRFLPGAQRRQMRREGRRQGQGMGSMQQPALD